MADSSPASDPVATVEGTPAPQMIDFWNAQLRTTAGLISTCRDEYVPKERLRNIALMALAQLYAMFSNGKEEEERARAEEPASGLILPENSGKIILP